MRVTDSARASSAATLLVAGFAANLGLTFLSWVINLVLSPSFDGPWRTIEELLWTGSSVVLVIGLLQLAGALEDRTLPLVTAVAWIAMTLVDLAGLVLQHTAGDLGRYAWDLSALLSLGARGLLWVLAARLAMATRAWVVPLLGVVAILSLGRTALSVATSHQLVSTELYRSPFYGPVSMAVSLFNVVAMLVVMLAVKAAVSGASVVPAGAAAGLVPSPEVPESPAADFVVGGILLLVGVGVTVVSLAAASNGGRYLVATGAIGVGLGRLIRGFIRLAKR